MRITEMITRRSTTGFSALVSLFVLSACSTDSTSPTADAAAHKAGQDICSARRDECRPGVNGRIAFYQLTDTGVAIFSSKSDGSDVKQLTIPLGFEVTTDQLPDWSPDASRLVFERDYGGRDYGSAQIFRVNADGSGLKQLNDCTGLCLGNVEPSFSPDGRIAFGIAVGPITPENSATDLGIWVMDANGNNPVRITPLMSPMKWEPHFPAWSPDGRHMAYARLNITDQPAGRFAIFVMDADGRNSHRITPWALDAFSPTWSPDGNMILFSSHPDPTPAMPGELYTVRTDGTGLHKIRPQGITAPPDYYALIAGYGRFSPDGRSIVFQHQDPTTAVVLKMNLDGSGLSAVTTDETVSGQPTWGTHP